MSSSVGETIVLITGGNTGLGYAIAQALLLSPAAKPYTILITSRSLARAQEAAEKLNADDSLKAGFESGSRVFGFALDITKDDEIKQIREDVGEKFGRLDVLVNNAGKHAQRDFLSHAKAAPTPRYQSRRAS